MIQLQQLRQICFNEYLSGRGEGGWVGKGGPLWSPALPFNNEAPLHDFTNYLLPDITCRAGSGVHDGTQSGRLCIGRSRRLGPFHMKHLMVGADLLRIAIDKGVIYANLD